MKAALQELLKDPRVSEVLDETDTKDGYWIYLKTGFVDVEAGIHMIHEPTIAKLKKAMKWIEPCECKECARKY